MPPFLPSNVHTSYSIWYTMDTLEVFTKEGGGTRFGSSFHLSLTGVRRINL